MSYIDVFVHIGPDLTGGARSSKIAANPAPGSLQEAEIMCSVCTLQPQMCLFCRPFRYSAMIRSDMLNML